MTSNKTPPSNTFIRNDDEVGSRGEPAVGGGKQTPEQKTITEHGNHGRSDADRRTDQDGTHIDVGRNPVPVGGSSSGHSDRKDASGGRMVAQDPAEADRDRN